jgi:hypothetical protein
MLKLPKWKSTKILLILLLFGAFFEACRQKEILPEKNTPDAIDNATLAKIQNWYNPHVERLRKQKNAGTDIYLPQWGQGKLHTLPNGEKIALFPVHREKNVQYYDIGFVRRFAVYLTLQDSVKEVRLVEIIAPKAYLHQHKETLAKRYVLGDTVQWKQVVWSRKLNLPSANKITSPDNPCDITEKKWYLWSNSGNCYVTIQNNGTCGIEGSTFPIDCPDDLGGGSSSSGGWNPPPPPSGGGNPPNNGGNPTGGNPATGGSGGAPIYTENPLPCANCPVDGFDPGDNTNQEPPRKITLNDAFKNDPKANCVYERIKKMVEDGSSNTYNNLFWRMTAPFSGANAPRLEIALVDSTVTGEYTGGLTVDSIATKGKVVVYINKQLMSGMSDLVYAFNILHELMHAYFIAMVHKVGVTAFNNCILLNIGCSSGLMPQKPYSDFKDCYNNLKDQANGFDELEHNVMATDKYGYRQDLIKAMKAFMGTDSPQISNDMYSAISWIGLANTEVYNDTTIITNSQKEAIENFMRQAFPPSSLYQNEI